MTGTPTQSDLERLELRREAIRKRAEALCLEVRSSGREQFTAGEGQRLAAMQADLRDLDDSIHETRQDVERSGIPPRYRNLGGGERRVNTAAMLSPLGYEQEQLRRAFDQVNRGETAVLEKRDPGFTSATSLIPPYLSPLPIFPRHEQRLLDRLPGMSIDVPSIEYIEVVSTSGVATIVAEGATKPELTMPSDQKTATARKIAAHVGVSWEAYSGDFPAFTVAVQNELMRCIVDAENLQLVSGTGDANGQVNGLLSSPNILTFAAQGTTGANPNNFDDIAGAIATLRTGPALAEPDLLLLHPNTWASIRTQKAAGTGMYFVSPDPSTDQVEEVWGVSVLQSVQFTAGVGVLLDTSLYGRVVVREGLITRIGYAGTDFTQNIVRFLSEERLTQTIERPQAICKITGLPTAAPSVAETKSTARK